MLKVLAAFFCFFILATNLNADRKQDALKGVVLQRISQFITFENEKSEFVICIYDDEEMTETFKSLYNNRKHQNIPIKVLHVTQASLIKKCDVLYVKNRNIDLIKKIKTDKLLNTLLVTEDIDLLDDGFMLALYLQDNKIKFAINHQAINDAKLKVNYRLLKVASKVINPLKSN